MLPSSVSLDGFLKTVAADEGSRQNSKLNAQMRTRGLTALVMQRDQTRATKGTDLHCNMMLLVLPDAMVEARQAQEREQGEHGEGGGEEGGRHGERFVHRVAQTLHPAHTSVDTAESDTVAIASQHRGRARDAPGSPLPEQGVPRSAEATVEALLWESPPLRDGGGGLLPLNLFAAQAANLPQPKHPGDLIRIRGLKWAFSSPGDEKLAGSSAFPFNASGKIGAPTQFALYSAFPAPSPASPEDGMSIGPGGGHPGEAAPATASPQEAFGPYSATSAYPSELTAQARSCLLCVRQGLQKLRKRRMLLGANCPRSRPPRVPLDESAGQDTSGEDLAGSDPPAPAADAAGTSGGPSAPQGGFFRTLSTLTTEGTFDLCCKIVHVEEEGPPTVSGDPALAFYIWDGTDLPPAPHHSARSPWPDVSEWWKAGPLGSPGEAPPFPTRSSSIAASQHLSLHSWPSFLQPPTAVLGGLPLLGSLVRVHCTGSDWAQDRAKDREQEGHLRGHVESVVTGFQKEQQHPAQQSVEAELCSEKCEAAALEQNGTSPKRRKLLCGAHLDHRLRPTNAPETSAAAASHLPPPAPASCLCCCWACRAADKPWVRLRKVKASIVSLAASDVAPAAGGADVGKAAGPLCSWTVQFDLKDSRLSPILDLVPPVVQRDRQYCERLHAWEGAAGPIVGLPPPSPPHCPLPGPTRGLTVVSGAARKQPFSTLRQILCTQKVPNKFRCWVRLVAAHPPPLSLCQPHTEPQGGSERRPGTDAPAGAPRANGSSEPAAAPPDANDSICIRLLLADPTAFLPVLLSHEDAASFFGLSELDLSSEDGFSRVAATRLHGALLKSSLPEGLSRAGSGDGSGAAEGVTQEENGSDRGLWMDCCLKSYRTTGTNAQVAYRVFATRLAPGM